MLILKEKIISSGKVFSGDFVKIESLNSKIVDEDLMIDIGMEFYERFKDKKVTKIIANENSCIAMAMITGESIGAQVVFVKKDKSLHTSLDSYKTTVYSDESGDSFEMSIPKEHLKHGDNILIIDDYLATGSSILGIMDLIKQSGANLIGIGVAIEKTFQNGGNYLRNIGVRIESLARIKSIQNNILYLDD